MSDLFDKRSEGASRRDERSMREHNAKKKTKTITIAVVSVVLVAFIAALIINSTFIRRSVTAITIGGRGFTAAEFDYFYNTSIHEYTEYINANMAGFASALLPARDRPLASQFQDSETGTTWADFFVEQAIERVSAIMRIYNAAIASGFEMGEADIAELEEELGFFMTQGEMAVAMSPAMYPTPMSYLQQLFGSSLDENTLRSVLNLEFTARAYNRHVFESVVHSEAELEAYYQENRDELDVFVYRELLIRPADTNPDADPDRFQTGDELADANERANEEAAEIVAHITQNVATEEDFIAAARDYDFLRFFEQDSTLRELQGQLLDERVSPWLIDDERAHGDIETFEADYGTYILFFVERDDNNYQMASMRQILILREAPSLDNFPELGEFDPEYQDAIEGAEAFARARAEMALEAFIAGGATEQALIDLMPDFSDDNTDGFYENISRFPYQSESARTMRVVHELENWLFDSARQVGDYQLIRTEAFGFHLMYFTGFGELFSNFMASDRMRVEHHQSWREGLPEVEASRSWAFFLTHQ